MKLKLKSLAAAALSTVLLTSCYAFKDAYQATDNPVGKKSGEGCFNIYLGLFSDGGDASIASVAAKAGITKIGAVDYRYNSIMGFVMTKCTIVTGE